MNIASQSEIFATSHAHSTLYGKLTGESFLCTQWQQGPEEWQRGTTLLIDAFG